MKNFYSLTLFFLFVSFNISTFCQQDNCIENINQFTTGKDQLTFYVLDCETNEPLIGVTIYSFDQDKELATTDIDGVAKTAKNLEGNLEVSYIAYYSICFKLDDKSIDSIQLWMKPSPLNFGFDVVILDSNAILQMEKVKFDANKDLSEGKIQLLINSEPTEEQVIFAENHNFEFIFWEGDKSYPDAYNEVMMDFLKLEHNQNIEEELRAICWRIYQP